MAGKIGWLGRLILVSVLGSTSGLILLIASPEDSDFNLRSPATRFILCVGFIFWGYVYYAADETSWKLAFGLVQLVSALWSNWHQLAKIAEEIPQKESYDR